MDSKNKPPARGPDGAPTVKGDVAAFLKAAAVTPRPVGGRGRLIFALDATMSRQPTWDMACAIQGEMFAEAAKVGSLDVQLVYFRGLNECQASGWIGEAARLQTLMGRMTCRGGHTQIARILTHAAEEAEAGRVHALVFVGDAMEEDVDDLCARAGRLALRGLPCFLFQEGHDPAAERAFREIARITKGAYARFDAGAAGELAALLKAVAVFATGGRDALLAIGERGDAGARRLIGQVR